MADPNLIEGYLGALRLALGPAASASRGFLDEVRDHLLSAVETEAAAGASTRAAEEAAVARFGAPQVVVQAWLEERRRFSFGRSTVVTSLAIATLLMLHEVTSALGRVAGLPLEQEARSLLLLAGACTLPVFGLYGSVRLTNRLSKPVLLSAAVLAAFAAWCSLGGATVALCQLPGNSLAGASSIALAVHGLALAQWAVSLVASAAAVWGIGWLHLTWRVA